MFHKEGHRIIIASFFFTVSVIISSDILIESENIKITLQSGFLIFYSLILWFFRNPKRKIDIDNNLVLSPADGKVVNIEQVKENEFFKAAESVSARNLIKSAGLVKVSTSIELESFDFSFLEFLSFTTKSSEITFAGEWFGLIRNV